MPEQRAPQEVNDFKAGLVTDANPINFPSNAVKEIDNIVIDRNGKNSRRLGMDKEGNAQDITTNQDGSETLANKTFKWENVSSNEDKSISVIQVGNQIDFIDLDAVPISSGRIHTHTFPSMNASQSVSFDQVDSFLVVVNGDGNIYSFEYDESTNTISNDFSRLQVRDLWGVEDIWEGEDLFAGNSIQTRPSSLTNEHTYNLRNQTFGIQRASGPNSSGPMRDCITEFWGWARTNGRAVYPSNSDSVNYALYPNARSEQQPYVDRFWGEDLFKNKIGSFETSKGFFIIDALRRGTSRLEEELKNRGENPAFVRFVNNLPQDETVGGATVVTQFAGRAMYAGFGSQIIDGDSKSPNLGSYILFTQLIKDASDFNKCYQEADPTSNIDNDIVATDGGFIRIDGCHNIIALKATSSSLIVIAKNGVWRVVGGSDYGFSADNYKVERLSEEGCSSPSSVISFDNTVMFWGDNGIYSTAVSKLGDWGVQNVTRDRIQKLFNSIGVEDKRAAQGSYDTFDRKVRWLYYNLTSSADNTKELVYDIDLNAFYVNTIKHLAEGLPKVVSLVTSNPFTSGEVTDFVTVNGDEVDVNSEAITLTTEYKAGSTQEIVYVVMTQRSPTVKYTFATYSNQDFTDWETVDGVGLDAEAYFITGALSAGETQRRKQANSMVVHMDRTESSTSLVDGVLVADDPSSCLIQAQWDWSNSNKSNRWSSPRQFYRYKKTYEPEDESDDWDTGYELMISKDIIRGHGKSLSLKFYSEPKHNMRINGWAMVWAVGDSEGR